MGQLPFTAQALTNSEFQQLFGHSKRTRRYLCHSCIYKAETKFSSPELDACKTALLEKDGLALSCVMCGERFKVLRLNASRLGAKAMSSETMMTSTLVHVTAAERIRRLILKRKTTS
jgi:hypothetical protein